MTFSVLDSNGAVVTFKSANTANVETVTHNAQLQVANAFVSNSNPVPVQANGQIAHDSTVAGNPFRLGARGLNANYTPVANNDTADLKSTLDGALVVRPWTIPELCWKYAAAAGGIADTSDVVLAASAGAGLKNYLTSIQILNAHATVNTEVVVKSAATVVWRGFLRALGGVPTAFTFDPPIASAAAEALNFACVTTGSNTYVNAQGFIAP